MDAKTAIEELQEQATWADRCIKSIDDGTMDTDDEGYYSTSESLARMRVKWQREKDSCDLAIAALSKQVPMKPVKHKYKVVHNDEADKYLDHADSFYACPNCLNLVDKQDSYCRYCGKKITGGNDLW